MSLSPECRMELLELVAIVRDQTATNADRGRLRALVIENREARQLYIRQLHLAASLQWSLEDQDPVSDQARSAARTLPASTPVLGFLGKIYNASPNWLTVPRLLVVAVSMSLVMYFGALVVSVVWDHAHRANRKPRRPSPDASASVATLIAADNCQWNGDAPARPGEPVGKSIISLLQGTVDLSFGKGAQVTVEGPAEFEVRTANGGFLRRGRLTAAVPPSAIGFTIETPTAEIVDLGTEFGVDVAPTGRTDVQVIKGTVNVNYSSQADDSKSARRSVQMSAGTAKRFDKRSGTADELVSEIAPWLDKTTHAGNSRDKRQNLPAETKYAAAVLDDHPLGYWRLSDVGKDIATDASGHGNHGKYQGIVSRSNSGICPATNDRSVRFLGPSFKGYVQIDDFELPISFTVELWIRSAAPRWNSYGWPLSSRGPHGVVICPVGTGKNWFFLVHNARGEQRAMGPYGLENIADRFHYFVGAYDSASDQAWVYVDGKLVAQGANLLGDDRRREPVRLKFLIGKDDLGLSRDTYGDGWVDEVAIYDQALSAEAIERHFNAADLMEADATATSVVPGNK